MNYETVSTISKYTANYSYTNNNFVIQNLDKKNHINNELYPTFCILKNIIQRGKPSLLSSFLQEKIGAIHKNNDFISAYPLIDNDVPVWYGTIKGTTEKCYNPAQYFFENIIPEYFNEFGYIQSLIIPEVEINTITQEYNKDFINQRVDFYLPQAFLIIEIDGVQHNDKSQKILDEKRDEYLKRKGYAIVRFQTNELNTKNSTFLQKIEQIKKYLKKVDNYQQKFKIEDKTFITLSDYASAYNNGINLECIYYKATAIIRFQILILELLCTGKLDFNGDWNFEIVYNDIDGNFVELAISDVLNWLSVLFSLRKIPFDFNKKNNKIHITRKQSLNNFSNDKNTIFIDFSLLKRYTDENDLYKNVLFVRNDYFDKNLTLEYKNKSFKDIDYFEIATADIINYDIDITDKDDYNSLLTLTWDIFLQAKESLQKDTVTFRDGQFEIIANALNRNDTIGLLPTGSGKSVCYQIACILQPAISFVIVPIISLMTDQTENLNSCYFHHIAYISGDINSDEKRRIQDNFSKGKFFFIFISPERLQTVSFIKYLTELNNKFQMAYVVIDEAHCLSEWGHDFRISYLNLVDTIKSICSNHKFIALTATASSNVLKDLRVELNITKEKDIKTPFKYSRDELEFSVIEDTGNKYSTLLEILKKLSTNPFYTSDDKAGLIFTPYAGGQIGTNTISSKLKVDLKKQIGCYNGKLSTEEKRKAQSDYKNNVTNLLVATKAFGMGIDKGNIAYTVHYGIPSSMESLYQEAGRAGRERNLFEKYNAKCMVLLTREYLEDKKYKILWSPKSTYEEICKVYQDLKGDLKTQLYFFVAGNKSIEYDCKKIVEFYNRIKVLVSKKVSEFAPKCSRNEAEKYLYKLKQLGIISLWTVDFRADIFDLRINEANIDNFKVIKNNLQAYINKYDKEFSFENLKNNSNYDYCQKIWEEDIPEIEKYIKILLQWNFNTFVYTRRQSLKNIYENCINFTDKENMNPEKFKNNIENYFKFSGKTEVLKAIADEPLNHRKWFETFYEYSENINDITKQGIPEESVQELIGNLSRLLESYMQNTGLDFVSGLARLFIDDYENTDGRIRFENSLKKIKEFNKSDQEEIMFNLFKIAKKLPLKNKNELSKSLTDVYSCDKEFLYKIHDNLADDNSLQLTANGFLNRIKIVKSRIEV